MTRLSCFKAYDVRGRIGEDIDAELAFAFGQAVVQCLNAETVVLGFDARETSPEFAEAVAEGVAASGGTALELGLCGTEEVYFATDHLNAHAGVMVTASHNPIDYNGFKVVGAGSKPLPDGTFQAIENATREALADGGQGESAHGARKSVRVRDAYVEKVCGFVTPTNFQGQSLVVNAGNGAAGPTFDAILEHIESRGGALKVDRLHHVPDASFPNGIPNPLLPENQPVTADRVVQKAADLGVAWDGDFDRCFFFDEAGAFVAGELVVGLLAQAVLGRNQDAAIVHDPRVVMNTRRIVSELGGRAVAARTGHALVKAKMREVNAEYGGEMSAHHYFRDFMFCDSGMIPWLLILESMVTSGRSLSTMVSEMRARHPSSGEINFHVADKERVINEIEARYTKDARDIDRLDGLSVEFDAWRYNVRMSNTEPVLRLNVETLGDPALLAEKVGLLSEVISEG